MNIASAFLKTISQVKGFDEAAFLQAHQQAQIPVAIRLNPRKNDAALMEHLGTSGIQVHEPVPWCNNGYYLNTRPAFITDPHFHAGAYYVQEASSMFLEQALKQHAGLTQPLRVLDLCAAPGGKTTLIESLLSDRSLLVSNETIRSRTGVLAGNCSRWGTEQVVVTGNAPADFRRLPKFFDVVVADVPCSGSGLFRKDPQAMNEWSPDQVLFCSRRQQKIIADVWPTLKTGGLLIYSTCSFSEEENEQVADQIASMFRVKHLPVSLNPEWNIVETESGIHGMKGYRFFPDKLKGEGFYLTVLQKQEEEAETATIQKPIRKSHRDKNLSALTRAYLDNRRNQPALLLHENEVLAFPEQHLEALELLQSTLYIKKAGVHVGSVKHDALIPHADLPLSSLCHPDLPSVSVNSEQALEFLRKNQLTLPHAPKGWCIAKFGPLNLGWIKVLNGRTNNHYPALWRILHR